jgi:hypothetical protein
VTAENPISESVPIEAPERRSGNPLVVAGFGVVILGLLALLFYLLSS